MCLNCSISAVTNERGGLDINKDPITLEDSDDDDDEERSDSLMYRGQAPGPESFFDDYQRLDRIYKFLDLLLFDYPKLVSISTVGKSYEGREIRIIKIGLDQKNNTKPIIYIDCAIHAREWIALSTCMYIANRLLTDYEFDPKVKKLVDTFDWYIIPVANPDGYEYTHTRVRKINFVLNVHLSDYIIGQNVAENKIEYKFSLGM